MNPAQTMWYFRAAIVLALSFFAGAGLAVSPAAGQQSPPDWQAQVRKYAEAQDWSAALRLVDQQTARAPEDLDARAWHARVLAWSGQLAEAEREYLEIVAVAPRDADNWLGLANVYSRQGKTREALQALDLAIEVDPKRADVRAAKGRALLALRQPKDARREFQIALDLDPASAEAHAGMLSLRGEPKHELRFGQDNDLFNFANANHDELLSLASRWTPHWTTNVAGSFYQRGGMDARKILGSVSGRLPRWGALTAGGATAHDNGVIPQSEAFFEYDRGGKLSETSFVRGVEFVYGQHWYWYTTARILSLNGATVVYLPREWTWSFAFTEARSHFSGIVPEWRPSGTARLAFPIAGKSQKRVSGNIFYAVGAENFAQVDQIGSFSSHTYGGGLRFQWTARQDVTAFAGYQKRTQDRTDTTFGFTYGIRF